MNSLRDLWGDRFGKYAAELQRYLQYVFTGHLAIVLLFSIGAAGYAYSEWLKDVPPGLPAAWITAALIGGAMVFATPVTLLKPADAVYLLPLEQELRSYTGRALSWTFFSKLPLPVVLFIVALPMLGAYELGSRPLYVVLFAVILAGVWLNVHSEFAFRRSEEGQGIWMDRFLRFAAGALAIYGILTASWVLAIGAAAVFIAYFTYWTKRAGNKPFAYTHFIELEQNRMMGFYRFANYFTDVPHLKGSVSRRAWLGLFMRDPDVGRTDAQRFLLRRTFIRTDEPFWLWLRLTLLSVAGVVFIPFPAVAFIFVGALAFASAIQTLQTLRSGDEFRMDLLFPQAEETRSREIFRLTERVQWIQAAAVTAAAFIPHGLTAAPVLLGAVAVIISEATIRLSGRKEQE